MTITKLEAARRQLDVAIRLYFAEDDPIAVHTVVGASHILVTDLSKAAKLESILDRCIVPDYRWKFEGAIGAGPSIRPFEVSEVMAGPIFGSGTAAAELTAGVVALV